MIRNINSENSTLSIIFKGGTCLYDVTDADFPNNFISDGFIHYWDNEANSLIARPLSEVSFYYIKENANESK